MIFTRTIRCLACLCWSQFQLLKATKFSLALHVKFRVAQNWIWTGGFDSQALEAFGEDIAIAFSGAEDVALVEYAHLTGRPFRVFRSEPGHQCAVPSISIDNND